MASDKPVIGQQLVAQLVTLLWKKHINLCFLLTLTSLKTILVGNTPAKPMEFDLSNFMLKLSGFSFFYALLISPTSKYSSQVVNNHERLM
ncbi:MAG: hypothetical protein ACI935_001893 [Moritella dasanensis]|jgi:hypothetical protein